MRMEAPRLARVVCALIATLACGPDPESATRSDFEAPVRARAVLALGPEVLHVGEVVTVEVLVVAPPSHRVSPVPRRHIEGVALLGAQALAPKKGPHRWTHRTRFRIRPESVGIFEWPALEIDIEPDDGDAYTLELPVRSFEVASLQDRFERDEPFGLEDLEATAPEGGLPGFFGGLALGVLLSVGVAMTLLLARRFSIHRAEAQPAGDKPIALTLFDWTEGELSEALAVLDADPRRAASAGANLLRVYMARRFGSTTEASTTEELERRTPALAERSSWPDFVRILHHFDDERFRPRNGEAETGARVRSALEDSRRLIESSRPPPSRDA
jgi:hypothetical protein